MLSHRAWPHRLSPSTSHFLTRTTTTLAHAQSEESGIEPGHIATITGSFVSFGGQEALDHYDTDHTDLGSEADEGETKRELLRDQWRQFFDTFDPEGFGEIPWPDFIDVMKSPEFRERVNTGKRQIFLEKFRQTSTPAITFQDFVNVPSHSGDVTVVANSVCQEVYPSYIFNENVICTSGYVAFCQAEQGAGVVIDGKVAALAFGPLPVLVITEQCPIVPNTYLNIPKYLDWIKAHSDLE